MSRGGDFNRPIRFGKNQCCQNVTNGPKWARQLLWRRSADSSGKLPTVPQTKAARTRARREICNDRLMLLMLFEGNNHPSLPVCAPFNKSNTEKNLRPNILVRLSSHDQMVNDCPLNHISSWMWCQTRGHAQFCIGAFYSCCCVHT